jgi:hypothetical protein
MFPTFLVRNGRVAFNLVIVVWRIGPTIVTFGGSNVKVTTSAGGTAIEKKELREPIVNEITRDKKKKKNRLLTGIEPATHGKFLE